MKVFATKLLFKINKKYNLKDMLKISLIIVNKIRSKANTGYIAAVELNVVLGQQMLSVFSMLIDLFAILI